MNLKSILLTSCSVAQLCLLPCSPKDCSLPVSSVHGILQARILEWVAISYSRRSPQPRDRTHISDISCIGRWVLYHCATVLSRPTKGYKIQTTSTKKGRGAINTDLIEKDNNITLKAWFDYIKEYYKELCAPKFDNLDKTDWYLKRHALAKLTRKETDKENSHMHFLNWINN